MENTGVGGENEEEMQEQEEICDLDENDSVAN